MTRKPWLLMAALLLLSAFSSAACNTVTVADTLYDDNGNLLNGTVTIVNTMTITGADGCVVPAYSSKKATVTAGVLSVGLVPNNGSTPSGSYYTAEYHVSSKYFTETWTVPSTGPQTLAGVRALSPPVPTIMIAASQLTPPSPCTANQVLARSSDGLSWICAAAGVGGGGSGTVTSVAVTAPSEFSVSGSPVTVAGTIAISKANQNANQVYAGPTSGGAATPGFRGLVSADIPNNAANTSGTAAALAANAANCSGNNFALGVDATGAGECAQPAFSNLSGTSTKAQSPAADVYTDQANTFGAFLQKFQAGANFQLVDPTDTTKITQFDVSNIGTGTTRTVNVPNANSTTAQAKSAVASNWLRSMDAQGLFAASQPAFTDISGSATDAQIPDNITINLAAQATALAANGANCSGNNFALGVDASGTAECAQPAFSNISGSVAAGQMPALTGDATSSAGTVATTVVKVNGVAYSASPSTDTVPVITAANTATYTAVPSCSNAVTSKLLYNTSTHVFSCGTDQGGGGGMTNPMTTLGDIIYEDATPTPARLPGNTSATKQFLSQTGNGSISAVPAWGQPALTDLASGTSADLRGVLSDEAGTGAAMFSPKQDLMDAAAFCSDAGANDTYTCNLSPAITAYVTGTNYRFKANTANTGAATINLNSLGAITIKKMSGAITTDLADNDIRANQWVDVVYDGTNMEMQGQLGNIVLSANGANCSAGQAPLGVDAAGAVETCTDYMEEPASTGMVAKTAANTSAARTITGTANRIGVTNGDGVSGNPTLDIGSSVVTDASTHTLTNKTYDAEGTGNTLTIPVVVYQDAAGCNNATASSALDLPTANAPTPTCLTGTNAQQGTLDYADGANSTGQTKLVLPSDWTGNMDIDLYWLVTASGGSNAVKWTVATACSAAAATYDTAFNTAQTITTNVGSNNNVTVSTQTTLTSTGCSADNLLHLKIGRDVTDTFTGTARLLGFRLKLRRAM